MSGAVSKAFARAGAFCCANDTLDKSRTTTSKNDFFDPFIRASKKSNSFAYEACRVFRITAAFIGRHLRVLADKPSSYHLFVLVVIEHQLLWRITRLFPLFDNVERVVIEVFLTARAGPMTDAGYHKESHCSRATSCRTDSSFGDRRLRSSS